MPMNSIHMILLSDLQSHDLCPEQFSVQLNRMCNPSDTLQQFKLNKAIVRRIKAVTD